MYNALAKKQDGAALVVGLLILLLATFLAVATMNNANMQERMAANSQNENLAFQAAESAVDAQIELVMDGDTSNLANARAQYGVATPAWPTDTYDAGDTDITTNIEIRSMGDMTLSSGNSIDADESSVRLTGARFEMRSVSTIAGSGARASIVQGLEYR